MPLDLDKVAPQVRGMVGRIKAEAREREKRLESALTTFARQSGRLAELSQKIAAARTTWLVAGLAEEPDRRYPPPPAPSDFTILATDGSHIAVDRHCAARCYLINIGAGRLIEERVQLKFPPPPFPVREIKLDTPGTSGMLEKLSAAMAYVMGFIGGLGLRVFLRFRKEPKFEPPEVTYLSFEDVFTPLPPLPNKPKNKVLLSIMNFLFMRMDIVNIIETGVSGMKASGVFKKPIQLMPPLSQIMREQMKLGT